MGVFTKIQIPANMPLFEFRGTLYKKANMPQPESPALLQVGHDLFIGPSGDIDDYINHSCNPNCYLQIVGNRAIVYSLHVIQPDTELTFDYSTSSTDDLSSWKMECLCGSHKCRKIISGLKYVDEKIIKEYKEKDMIPTFLNNKIFK